jgi:hypothetical protein
MACQNIMGKMKYLSYQLCNPGNPAGLMIRFTGLFDTACDARAHAHTHTHTHTGVRSQVFTAVAPQQLPFPLVYPTVPGLSYQLLTATADND